MSRTYEGEEEFLREGIRQRADLLNRKNSSSLREWIQTFMPIVQVILSAILITYVGSYLQDRSFRRNELFKAKLEQINNSERESLQVLRDVTESFRTIEANETFIALQLSQARSSQERSEIIRFYKDNPKSIAALNAEIGIIKGSELLLSSLKDSAKGIKGTESISNSVDIYLTQAKSLVRCLEKNKREGYSETCSENHVDLVNNLQDVVSAHKVAAQGLIEEYE